MAQNLQKAYKSSNHDPNIIWKSPRIEKKNLLLKFMLGLKSRSGSY